MRNSLKKTIAFIMSLTLVVGFTSLKQEAFQTNGTAIVASAAEAEIEAVEPPDPETVEYDNVTYYNTHVDDFTSSRAIMLDYMGAKSPELDGYSMADLWILTAS